MINRGKGYNDVPIMLDDADQHDRQWNYNLLL